MWDCFLPDFRQARELIYSISPSGFQCFPAKLLSGKPTVLLETSEYWISQFPHSFVANRSSSGCKVPGNTAAKTHLLAHLYCIKTRKNVILGVHFHSLTPNALYLLPPHHIIFHVNLSISRPVAQSAAEQTGCRVHKWVRISKWVWWPLKLHEINISRHPARCRLLQSLGRSLKLSEFHKTFISWLSRHIVPACCWLQGAIWKRANPRLTPNKWRETLAPEPVTSRQRVQVRVSGVVITRDLWLGLYEREDVSGEHRLNASMSFTNLIYILIKV